MDVKAWAEQAVGNVHHFDFTDIEGVGTEFDAGAACIPVPQATRQRVVSRCVATVPYAAPRFQARWTSREICGREVHGREQRLADEVHHKLAMSIDVSGCVFECPVVFSGHADPDIQWLTTKGIEKLKGARLTVPLAHCASIPRQSGEERRDSTRAYSLRQACARRDRYASVFR